MCWELLKGLKMFRNNLKMVYFVVTAYVLTYGGCKSVKIFTAGHKTAFFLFYLAFLVSFNMLSLFSTVNYIQKGDFFQTKDKSKH